RSSEVENMKLHVRSFALGALAAGIVAAGIALVSRGHDPAASPAAGSHTRVDPSVAAKDRETTEHAHPIAGDESRERVAAAVRTPSELRAVLAGSSSRRDQVEAIDALLADGSIEAKKALLDAFLETDDKVLRALLEEALMRSPQDMAPVLMAAFDGARDGAKLEGLAHLLRKAAENRPELAEPIVAFLIHALDEAGDPRAGSAAAALQAFGGGAVEQLGARLRDPGCGPEAAGALADILAKLPKEYDGVLREKVAQGFDATRDVLRDPQANAADKDVARKKTGSLAWAASVREPSEQDALAPVLADQLGRTVDAAQAGTLAWGIGEMRGLSDAGRSRAALALLDSFPNQRDGDIRLIMSRSLVQLAQSGMAGSRDSIRELVAAAEAGESNPKIQAQLRQMIETLDAGK
ncbi:MAG TPA: hypothetical protein VKE69_03630, partial [Planctomycetota bacterium]|nr:hypothetical protein [Planctomycetota bacterium]